MLSLLQKSREVHSQRDALAVQSICLSTAAAIPLSGVPHHHHQSSGAVRSGGEALKEVSLQLLLLNKAGMEQGKELGAAMTAERRFPNP